MDDVAANYATAFDGHLAFGKRPALLIVDFVMAYLEPSSPLYAGVESALASNERLVALARELEIPVLFTNVVYEPGGANGGTVLQEDPGIAVVRCGLASGAIPTIIATGGR